MRFSERLIRIRRDNGYSQRQLADELDIPIRAVEDWETGNAYPERNELLRICKLLKCNLKDLGDDIEENNNEHHSSKKSGISSVIDGVLNFITKSYDMFYNMEFRERIRCLCEMLIATVILVVVGVVLHKAVYNFMESIMGHLTIGSRIIAILSNIFKIALQVTGIILWIQLFKIRYLNDYLAEENSDTEGINLRGVRDSISGILHILGKGILIILKIIAAICAIPLLILFVGLIIFIVIGLYHIQYGLVFLWIALVLLGVNLLIFGLVKLAYKFIMSDLQYFASEITMGVIGLVIIGIGVGMSISNYVEYDSADSFAEERYMEEIITVPMEDNLVLSDKNLPNCKYEIDNFESDVKIEIRYLNNINYKVDYNNVLTYKDYYIDQDFKLLDTYKLIVEDLKDNKIRNYKKAQYIEVIITTSQYNYSKLQKNYEDLSKKQNSSNSTYQIQGK